MGSPVISQMPRNQLTQTARSVTISSDQVGTPSSLRRLPGFDFRHLILYNQRALLNIKQVCE